MRYDEFLKLSGLSDMQVTYSQYMKLESIYMYTVDSIGKQLFVNQFMKYYCKYEKEYKEELLPGIYCICLEDTHLKMKLNNKIFKKTYKKMKELLYIKELKEV